MFVQSLVHFEINVLILVHLIVLHTWSTQKTCFPVEDANAMRANAPLSKGKFISCTTKEVNANTIRVKAFTQGSVS